MPRRDDVRRPGHCRHSHDFARTPPVVPVADPAGRRAPRSLPRVVERGAHRLRAHVAGAGVHARRAGGTGIRRASRLDAQGSASGRPRARRRRADARAHAASHARAGLRPVHRGGPLRHPRARHAADRVRSQDRDAHPALRAEAGRRVRLPRGPRSLSADAARSSDGAARGAARAGRRRAEGRAPSPRSARRTASPKRRSSPGHRAGEGSRSRSIPGTAARTRAPSGSAARTRRT